MCLEVVSLKSLLSDSGDVYLLALACLPAQTGSSLVSLSPPHVSAAGEVSYAPEMSYMRTRGKQHPLNTRGHNLNTRMW